MKQNWKTLWLLSQNIKKWKKMGWKSTLEDAIAVKRDVLRTIASALKKDWAVQDSANAFNAKIFKSN